MSNAFATTWTVAHQAPLSMGFPGQEYWSGLLCPASGDLPGPGIELSSLMSTALTGRFVTAEPPGKPKGEIQIFKKFSYILTLTVLNKCY